MRITRFSRIEHRSCYLRTQRDRKIYGKTQPIAFSPISGEARLSKQNISSRLKIVCCGLRIDFILFKAERAFLAQTTTISFIIVGIIAGHGSPLLTNQSIFHARTHARTHACTMYIRTHASNQPGGQASWQAQTRGGTHSGRAIAPSSRRVKPRTHPRIHDNSPPLISVHHLSCLVPIEPPLCYPANPDLATGVSEPWPSILYFPPSLDLQHIAWFPRCNSMEANKFYFQRYPLGVLCTSGARREFKCGFNDM